MKKFKRILSIVLAMTMVLAMGVTAFADEVTPSGKISIANTPAGAKYEAYQILTGEYDAASGALSNVAFGAGVTAKDSSKTAKNVADDLAALVGNEQGVIDYINNNLNLTTKFQGPKDGGATVEFTNLPDGFYLVQDTADSKATDGTSKTRFVTRVVGGENVNATLKTGKTTSDKSVKDRNDSLAAAYTEWQKSADHDINDDIPYQLKATVDENIGNYKKYFLAFHDDMSAGLSYNNDAKVYLVKKGAAESSKTEITPNPFTYTTTTDDSQYTDGNVHHWTSENIKGIAEGGDTIIIEYTAKLTGDAVVIGNDGNKNTLTVEYSRNPNQKEDEEPDTEKTPPTTCVVFTYKVKVDKTDGEDNPLPKAAFKLEKFVKGENDAADEWKTIATFAAGDDVTTWTATGLDDGNYRLTETATPPGYNSIAPIEFTVEAVHDATSGTTKTELKVYTATGEVDAENNPIEIVYTKIDDNAGATIKVVNEQGAQLPSTGGIGTTIFYIVGAMLAVGAAVILVTKKRMNG